MEQLILFADYFSTDRRNTDLSNVVCLIPLFGIPPQGVNSLKQQLTVVLPMYNCERQIRTSVLDVLEIAHSISALIEVVVVDDGSTDETYESACELARIYPQVKVLRQQVHQGLSAAMEMVGRRLSVDRVVVHDGVSPIDCFELKTLLQMDRQPDTSPRQSVVRQTATTNLVGSRRFSSVRTVHQSMEHAHRRVTGFRWMQLEKPMIPRRRAISAPPLPISVPSNMSIMPTGMMPTV